jgi:hypothetical protein
MEIELEKVPSRPGPGNGEEPETVVKPRVRMDELLRRPFDVRSMALTGLFLLAVFYTIYFYAVASPPDHPGVAPELSSAPVR